MHLWSWCVLRSSLRGNFYLKRSRLIHMMRLLIIKHLLMQFYTFIRVEVEDACFRWFKFHNFATHGKYFRIFQASSFSSLSCYIFLDDDAVDVKWIIFKMKLELWLHAFAFLMQCRNNFTRKLTISALSGEFLIERWLALFLSDESWAYGWKLRSWFEGNLW